MLFKFFSILNWRQNLKPPSAPCPCFGVNASRKKQKHSMNYLSLSLFLFLSLSLFLFHSFCISAFIFVTHIHFIGRYIACVCVIARYLLVNHFQFLYFNFRTKPFQHFLSVFLCLTPFPSMSLSIILSVGLSTDLYIYESMSHAYVSFFSM